ncbi:MAG: tetratricopeptide repeat protein [Planctomycetaceae bacterium]
MDVSRTCPCGANTQFQTISFFEESADAAGPLVRSDLFFEERSLDVSCQMAGAVSKRGRLVYSLMLLCAFCGAGCQSGKLLGGFWNSKAEHPEMLADAQSQMTVEEHLAAGDREFTLHQANPAELAKSRSHYESVVQKSPEHVVAHHRLAIIADLQKQYSVAEAHYRTALKGAPQNPDLLHDAGYSLVLQGRSAEAKPYFERALALSPQYVDAAEKLALIHLKAGNTAAASQVLAQAMPQPQVQQTLARLSAAPAAAVEPEQTLIGRIKNNLEHLRPGSRDKQEPDLTQQVVAQVEQARRDAQLQQGQGIQQTAMQSYQPDPWGGRHESRLAPDGVSERGVHPSELAQHIANIDRDGQSRPSRPIVIDAQGNPTQMSQNSSHRGIDPWADQREHSRSNGPIYIDGPDQPQPRTTSQNPSQLSQGQYQSQYSPQNPYQPTGPQPSPIQEGTHLQGLVDREHPGQYQAGPYQPGQGPPVHDHQSTSTGYNDVLRRMELVRGDSSMGRGGVSRGGVQWPEATAEGGGDRRFIPGGAGATSASTGSGQFAEIIRGSERGVAGPIPSRFAPRSQQAGEGVDRNTSIAQWPQGSGAGDIQPAGGLVPGGLSEQGYDSTNRQSVPSHNEMRPSTPYYHDQQAQQSRRVFLPTRHLRVVGPGARRSME